MTTTEKKYEILQDQTLKWYGRTLHRIRRLSDGLVGGLVESEKNLSQEGECFVYDEAKVYDGAKVSDSAIVCECAEAFGNAKIFGKAEVGECAEVSDKAKVFGRADVCYDELVLGNVEATVPVLFRAMLRHDITVTDKHIRIGCEVHTFDIWEKHIEEIGKKNRYSDKEIAMYREVIFDFIKVRRSQGF